MILGEKKVKLSNILPVAPVPCSDPRSQPVIRLRNTASVFRRGPVGDLEDFFNAFPDA
jgi:hypothetical protein